MWLLLALACRDPVLEVIPGASTALTVVVTNPTDCPVCDPFADVDTLKLSVSVGEDVVASDNFAWPGEDVTLPDLTGFGVVRISLLGLADGRVISAGRTAEIPLVPDAEISVPLVFMPANRALPLAAEMVEGRSRHAALTRRDGSVLLIGGMDPRQERATGFVEQYDALTGTFAEFDPFPAPGLAAPRMATLPDGATLLAGGFAIIGGNHVAVDDAAVFDDTLGTFTEAGAMSEGRDGHCIAMFRDRQGIVLGGAEGAGDYLKPDEDTGQWAFSMLQMRDFDAGAVTGCVPLADGSVFVQGRDADSTGIWNGGDEDLDPAEAFAPIQEPSAGAFRYVEGASIVPMADGGALVIGGAEVGTGEVHADARLYTPSARRFQEAEGFGEPRFDAQIAPWIEDGWYVAGCGWADADRTEDDGSVELFELGTGERSPAFNLDRARPGCALSVLRDGSVLITGGYELGPTTGASAALLVPYLDPTVGG